MDGNMIIGIILLAFVAAAGLGAIIYFLLPKEATPLRSLMGSGAAPGFADLRDMRSRLKDDPTGAEYEKLKAATRRSAVKKKQTVTLEEKFFHAGIFYPVERLYYRRIGAVAPFIMAPVLGFLLYQAGPLYGVLGLILGALVGTQLPTHILDSKIKKRADDIMFYLPLVIEQIIIGVSSSLDIGPCIQRVVQMAEERDSHNPVTELLRFTQVYVKSGISLEEALSEIGKLAGHTELKHAFMSLAQVARHGGEITRQLQELADSVSSQREARIEGKIRQLELIATGPVSLVFLGFMVILLVGFFLQMGKAFG